MFKFLVISDTHFGYGKGTEREEDCWVTVEEAIRKAPELGADFIVLPGDIFDVKIPRPEDWSRALELFGKSKIPIYATHGNHERRGQNLTNPVEGLHNGGVLNYIHGRAETIEINGEKVSIYGLGWVPEAYSKQMFEEYDPKTSEGYNIFIFHQSIAPFIFNPMEPPSIGLEDLPKGFDLYINGHIHSFEQSKAHGKPFFIPGSTVTTQVNATEGLKEKGCVLVTVDGEAKMEFIPLESARRVYYKEIEVNGEKPSEIQDKIKDYLNSIPKSELKPLVRVRVIGKLPKGLSVRDLQLRQIKSNYPNLMLSLGTKLTEEDFEQRKKIFENIRDQKISVDEMGTNILDQMMKDMKIDFEYHKVFDYLIDGDADGAIRVLTGEDE